MYDIYTAALRRSAIFSIALFSFLQIVAGFILIADKAPDPDVRQQEIIIKNNFKGINNDLIL